MCQRLPEYSDLEESNNVLLTQNKTTIFIEDKNGIGVYSNLFENKLNSKKIEIRSKDNKINVIRIYSELKSRPEIKNSIFIVDLDYDNFIIKKKIEDSHFIYLEKYTLENYFITEKLIKKILCLKLNRNIDEIPKIFNFEKWKNFIAHIYLKIFPIFLLIEKNSLGIQTSKCKYPRFITKDIKNKANKFGVLNHSGLQNYLKEIKTRGINENLNIPTICSYKKCRRSLYMYNENILDILPGKQILELLRAQLSEIGKTTISSQEMISFGTICVDDSFENIINKINSLLIN